MNPPCTVYGVLCDNTYAPTWFARGQVAKQLAKGSKASKGVQRALDELAGWRAHIDTSFVYVGEVRTTTRFSEGGSSTASEQ